MKNFISSFPCPKGKAGPVFFIIILLISYSFNLSAQHNFGVGGQPDPSAKLDIQSTTAGFLPPRMNTEQMNAIPTPATGLTVFNTDCGAYSYYNGTSWLPMGTGGYSALEQPNNLTLQNGYACPSATNYFSVTPVPDAINYIWQFPDGDSVISGQGTTSIAVNLDTSVWNNWVSITAVSACATNAYYTTFNLYDNQAPTAYPPGGNMYNWGILAQWSNDNGYYYYNIQLATDSLFTNIVNTTTSGCCGAWMYPPQACGTYYFNVQAVTACGTSPWSNVISASYNGAGAIPQTPYVNSNDYTDFNAGWNGISFASGYNLMVATDAGFVNQVPGSPFNVGGNTSWTVTGLACNTTYYFQVNSYDACNNQSAYSTPASVTTNSGSPAQLQMPTVSPSNVCINQSGIAFSVAPLNDGENDSYIWSGLPPDATITNGAGTNNITVTMGATPGIYNVSVAGSWGGTCAPGASSSTVADTVVPGVPSTPGIVSGDASVCAYATGELYSIAPVANAYYPYVWTVTPDANIVSGQGTTNINVSFGVQPGNICVSSVNVCGNSSPSCTAVTVNGGSGGAPSITGQPSNVQVCGDGPNSGSFTVNTSSGGATYEWQVSTDNGNTFSDLSNGGVYSGVNTSILNITNATPNMNNYQYRCELGPCPVSLSNAATLNTQPPGSITFSYTGGLQSFTVPVCVTSITIEAFGAQGGNHAVGQSPCGCSGGLGADILGTFSVTPGQSLNILAGGQGQDDGADQWNGGAGGGGGSFVYSSGPNLLIAAGGGGGGALYDDGGNYPNGDVGQSGTCGSQSKSCWPGGCGASDGSGNVPGYGWNSIMSNPNPGGCDGGYGGGGCDGYHGGGGGGGYSGGGGDTGSDGCGGFGDGGGGGGSYNSGANQTNNSGVQTGNGQVVITW